MTKQSFNDYKLSTEVLKAIELLKFKSPTKVQGQVIPAALEKKDIIVKSQTGSGKTAAFGIPICDMVSWDDNKPQALVITPTRELAIQVKEDIFNIGRFRRLKVAAIYGKAPIYNQERELRQKTHVVVGTPGRIIDLIERGTFDTSNIKYLVIDEADEMLNMGFIRDIETIIDSLPAERVSMLLSATMPTDIQELSDKFMKDPVYVEIEDENKAIDRITQERYNVEQSGKLKFLRDITIVENPDSCIIFCNTQLTVDKVYAEFRNSKYTCEKIHGGMEQRDRLKVMTSFRKGLFRYLIATDVAARGIDIDDISLVINYDIPQDRENYVHRIGRTGRANKTGKAITLISEREEKYLEDILEFIGKDIPLKEKPSKEIVDNSRDHFMEKLNTKPETKEERGAGFSKEIMKLHINAGKKTKMRPVDIVGTLCSIKGITADDIGIISIADISTFVEILNNKGELVLAELQKTPIKGRIRKVNKSGT